MEWSMLQATGRDGVRHCSGCKQDVYYALSVGEARGYASAGHCVAVDVMSPRWRDDLAEPFHSRVCKACNMDLGWTYPGQLCPACDHVVERHMMVGRIA
jgi:hypothetical protein